MCHSLLTPWFMQISHVLQKAFFFFFSTKQCGVYVIVEDKELILPTFSLTVFYFSYSSVLTHGAGTSSASSPPLVLKIKACSQSARQLEKRSSAHTTQFWKVRTLRKNLSQCLSVNIELKQKVAGVKSICLPLYFHHQCIPKAVTFKYTGLVLPQRHRFTLIFGKCCHNWAFRGKR